MRSYVGQQFGLRCGERGDVCELSRIDVEANSVRDGDIGVRLRQISAIVIVLLAQEEVVEVVVGGQDISTTLFHGQQEVSPVG